MHFTQYTDVHSFHAATHDTLIKHEAQNVIPLGNILIGVKGQDKTDWRDPVNWLMATVKNRDDVQLSAIMTPPHNLTLYATDNKINKAAIDCLIEGLSDYPIPGITTEKTLAKYFAESYASSKDMTYKMEMDQRIYELTKVNPDIARVGTLRLLEERDMPFFPYWIEAFRANIDANLRGTPNTTMPIPNV